LGVVQLLVVFAIDLPRFVGTHNPDEISGTFGTNAYQLVFFLLVLTALLAGTFTFEKRRLSARVAPALFALVFVAVFLAQYRALLVTTAVALVTIVLLLGSRGRGLVAGMIAVACFAVTLSYVARGFPGLKFTGTVTTLRESPGFYLSRRLEPAKRILDLYADEPRFALTGTGPGTFSSRAWQTFALADSSSRSNVQGPYALALTGGKVYRTDVSDKYVVEPSRAEAPVDGSRSVTSPFASYLSLLAEVGVLGLALVLFVYLCATVRAARMTIACMRSSGQGDPLPALLVACTVAFTLLLQMGFLAGNWLEVARVTFPTWALAAVATREFDARKEAGS
jgi:hypothetical protein